MGNMITTQRLDVAGTWSTEVPEASTLPRGSRRLTGQSRRCATACWPHLVWNSASRVYDFESTLLLLLLLTYTQDTASDTTPQFIIIQIPLSAIYPKREPAGKHALRESWSDTKIALPHGACLSTAKFPGPLVLRLSNFNV